MSDWQPIETAPRDGTWFLACCDDDCSTRNYWLARWDAVGEFLCGMDAEDLTGPLLVPCLAYWQPLPALPKKD